MSNERVCRIEHRRRFVFGLPALLSACASPPMPAPAPPPPVAPRPAAPTVAAPAVPVPPPAVVPPAPTGAVAMPVPGPAAVPAPAALPATAAPPGTPGPPARLWTDQPAFSIVRLNVRDARGFGDYLTGHLPTIVAGGGRFLVAGAVPQTVEGDWPLRRMIVLQWPSANAFFAWYESSAYAPWRQIRQRAAEADLVLVQGVASSAPSETVPPAFAIFDAAVRDGASFERAVAGQLPGLRGAGGELLAEGGRFQIVEGTWFPRRVVLQRWPSTTAFRAWYDSAEYRPWREMRWAAAQADAALLEGLAEAPKRERGMP